MDDIAHESVDRKKVTMSDGVVASAASEPSSREELLIAELRKRTAELEEANRELRRVSHYRSLFLARMSQKQQVKIEYELAPEITTIVTDQGKLRQTLFNFIAWAVSRSPAGEAVRINIDDDADGMLLFKVIDNGETRADLPGVFDPEHGSANHEANINELGIIIGRKLLELINGRVTLENLVPRGLQATIQIPARPSKG